MSQHLPAHPHLDHLRKQAKALPGRWVADVSRSTRHPANPFQRAVIELDVAGDTVTITSGFIDEAGRRQHGENTVRVDGLEHVTDNGYGLTATWRGSHVFETVATKNGEVVGRGACGVSADGTTLTISAPEQEILLDRE